MSVQSQVRRVRYAASLADLFADPTTGFVYPRALTADVDVGVKTYKRAFLAGDHDHFPSARGEREASLKLETELLSFGGTGAGAATAAGDGENGLLLKSVFGTQTKDTGVALTTGSTATTLTATATTGFTVGGLVGVVDPATGTMHVRQVRAKTATVLTLCRPLPFTPAAGAVAYASAWYTHAEQGHQHLWFDVEGYDAVTADNWRRYVRGCLGDLELTLSGVGKMTWNLKALDWADKSGTTQGAPTYATGLPGFGMFPGRSTRVWLGAVSATPATALAFKLGNDVQPKPTIATASGVSGYYVKDAERTFEVTILHDDGGDAYMANLQTGAYVDLLVEITGNGPGNACALVAPVCEIDAVKMTSVNGLDAYQISGSVIRTDLPGSTVSAVPDFVLGML